MCGEVVQSVHSDVSVDKTSAMLYKEDCITMIGSSELVMSSEKDRQRRRFFRLPYPITAQPPLTTDDGSSYKVLEISEKSVVLELPQMAVVVGELMCGNIMFHDKTTEYIEGVVYRLDSRGAVVNLNNNISFHHVMREQSYINSRFPLFFRQKMAGKPNPENEV